MIESAAMLASSLYSCLTPTVLFLLLNLVIATIAVSSFISKPAGPTLLARSPSLVFDRLRSLSFRAQYHQSETLPEPETHTTIHKSEPEPEPESEEAQHHHHIDRSRSDTMPVAGEMPEKLPKKMKKSATLKSAFDHFEAEEAEEEMKTPKRPATTRAREKVEEEVEVDARADDFINRFRHQLKLQRLDSIRRYKEMIKRGAAN